MKVWASDTDPYNPVTYNVSILVKTVQPYCGGNYYGNRLTTFYQQVQENYYIELTAPSNIMVAGHDHHLVGWWEYEDNFTQWHQLTDGGIWIRRTYHGTVCGWEARYLLTS